MTKTYYELNKKEIQAKHKEYYKKNKKKIQKKNLEWRKNNSERVRIKQREWISRNRKNWNAQVLKRLKKANYKYEKTKAQRIIRGIKRKTRAKYPLKGKICDFCERKAVNRHHNTFPITVEDFNYVCLYCHQDIHGIKKGIPFKSIKMLNNYKGGTKINGNTINY